MNKDIIKLSIPTDKEYLTLVRLTVSGIASKLGFNIEEIEDIKVSVAEACINSLRFTNEDNISLSIEVGENFLTINVSDVIEEIPSGKISDRNFELGLLIIRSLMDEVEFTSCGIEMTKFIQKDEV